ncbi:MAG: extracellular solute-binding protein [Anaerolineae bacterium]|nr:extracellular solute-binding protein [Anaerolineae bacterium]
MLKSSLSRRAFLKTAGAASAAGLAAASGAFSLAQEVEPDPSLTGTLVFWGHGDHPLDYIRVEFLKKYPNVTLDWQQIEDHGAKFKTAMAAGTGAPDLYWMEATDVALYGAQGALLETTDMIEPIKDQLVAGKLNEAYVAEMGGYFGMPGDISTSGIYYRADILDELGITVPDDMLYEPEFLDILTQIAAAGKNAVLYPAGGATVGSAYWSWFDAQYGGSGPTSCDNAEVTINDDAGINAIKLIQKIHQTGATLEADWWTPEYWNAINTSQLVLDLAPAWGRGFWESNLNDDVKGVWRLAPLPRAVAGGPNTGVWGGATLVSPITTQNPELAKIFMQFAFGSMEGATAAGNWGIIPPYIPYLEGPFQELTTDLFGEQKIGQMWLKMANNLSLDFCRTAAYGAATGEILQPEIDAMIKGDEDIETGMQKVADGLAEILPDYQD